MEASMSVRGSVEESWLVALLDDMYLSCHCFADKATVVLTSQPLVDEGTHAALRWRAPSHFEGSSNGFELVTKSLLFAQLLLLSGQPVVVLVESRGEAWILRQASDKQPWEVYFRFALSSGRPVGQVLLVESALTLVWERREEPSGKTRILTRRLHLGDSLDENSLSEERSLVEIEGPCFLAASSKVVWVLQSEGVLAMDLNQRSRCDCPFKDLNRSYYRAAHQLTTLLPVQDEGLLSRGPSHMMLLRRHKNMRLLPSKVWNLKLVVEDMHLVEGLLISLSAQELRVFSLQSLMNCETITEDMSLNTKIVQPSCFPRKLWTRADEKGTVSVGIRCKDVLEIFWTISVKSGEYRLGDRSLSDAHRVPPHSGHTTSYTLNSEPHNVEDTSWLTNFDEDYNFQSDLPLTSQLVVVSRHFKAAGYKFDNQPIEQLIDSGVLVEVFRFHFNQKNVQIMQSLHYLAMAFGASRCLFLRCLDVTLICPEGITNRAQQDIVLMLLVLCGQHSIILRLLTLWNREKSMNIFSSFSRIERQHDFCFTNF